MKGRFCLLRLMGFVFARNVTPSTVVCKYTDNVVVWQTQHSHTSHAVSIRYKMSTGGIFWHRSCSNHPSVRAPVMFHTDHPSVRAPVMFHTDHPSVRAPVMFHTNHPSVRAPVMFHTDHPSVRAPVMFHTNHPSVRAPVMFHTNHPSVRAPVQHKPF